MAHAIEVTHMNGEPAIYPLQQIHHIGRNTDGRAVVNLISKESVTVQDRYEKVRNKMLDQSISATVEQVT